MGRQRHHHTARCEAIAELQARLDFLASVCLHLEWAADTAGDIRCKRCGVGVAWIAAQPGVEQAD